jgi:iron complex outermembrane receptor protein
MSSPRRSAPTPSALRLKPLALVVHLALAGSLVAALPAQAQSVAASQSYAIPAGPLAPALSRFAQQAGVDLAVDASRIQGLNTAGLQGTFGIEEGFRRLLQGSGYDASRTASGYVLVPVPRSAAEGKLLAAVNVTAGAPLAEELARPYAGGQVARGARLGMLGNRDMMETPFNITAYTADVVENQQARTVADVLANDPSVRFTTSSGHLYENFRVRGFDVNAGDLSVNGMFGMVPGGHVPVEFLERVEVQKGPGALFTGMPPGGGVGGVVNLVTKRATDDPLTRVTVDYTSDSQIGTHVDVGRRFGDTKQVGVRVNAAWRDGDTTLDGQSKKRDFLSVGTDYRGESLQLSADAYYSKEQIQGGTPAMFWFNNALASPLSAPDPKTNYFKGVYGTLENSGVMMRADYEINDKLSAFGAVGMQHHDYAGFINGTHARQIQANGNFTGIATGQYGFTDSVTAEAGLRSRFKTGSVGHEVVLQTSSLVQESGSATVAGVAYASNLYNPKPANIGRLPGRAGKTSESTLTSVALADTLSFAEDKVLLTLGLRDQRVETRNFNGTTGAEIFPAYDRSVVTPAAGLVLKPWAAPVSLYGNYVEGLSKGDTVTDVTSPQYRQTFAPYQTKQSEVGVKWDAGTFTNTLALFQVEKPSLIQTTVGGRNIYTDDGERRHRGLEWNSFGELSRNVRLLGGAAYTQAVMTRTPGNTMNGQTAVGVPKWQINLGAEWDTPWLPGLTLTGRVTHSSTQYLNLANTHEIPAWTILDLGARYSTRIQERKVVFRANLNNAFDKRYFSGSFSDNNSMATLGAPRTVTLSASMDF